MNGICLCDKCVLLQYYFFLIWPLLFALLILLFVSDSTSELESLFMGSITSWRPRNVRVKAIKREKLHL